MKKLLCLVAAAVCMGVGLFLSAQNLGAPTTTSIPAPSSTVATLATLDLDTLIAEDLATIDTSASTSNPPDDPSQPAHFPPSGNFKLIGPAKDDIDPQNPYNEVISFDTATDPLAVAMAFRAFGDHVKIHWFTDMIDLKYYFVGRSCGGGTPRIVLLVDANGDGKFNQSSGDFAANGHVNPPSTVGCPMNQWVHEDLTDSGNRWEITPGGAVPDLPNSFPYFTWNELIAAVNADFPNHRILAGFLIEDSQSFFPADRGCAYYDLLSIGPHPLSDHSDTSDGNKQPNNC